MADATVRLFLARHGRTAWNLERRFQGRTDIPLDDVGRAQALALANALRGRFEAVLSSELSRAAETARIIASALDLPLLAADAELGERGYGQLEGLTGEQCAAQHTELWNATRGDRNFLPPGGEPYEDVVERMHRALLRQVEQLRGRYRSALVISHGSSLRMFLEHLTGQPQRSLENLEYREVEHNGTRFQLTPR